MQAVNPSLSDWNIDTITNVHELLSNDERLIAQLPYDRLDLFLELIHACEQHENVIDEYVLQDTLETIRIVELVQRGWTDSK